MQSVADRAGVSRTTVSLAMRNSREVSAAMRERIKAIADELGYRPNPLVSTLMAARSGGKSEFRRMPLAVLDYFETADSRLAFPYYKSILRGLREQADARGFAAEVFKPPKSGADGMAALHRIFFTRNIRGIIVLPVPSNYHIPAFPWEHYCSVSIGYSVIDPPMHSVASKQYGNALLLYEKLHEAGYRRPGFLTSEAAEIRTLHHASAALHTHCKTHPDVVEIPPLDFDQPDQPKLLREWLRRHRPDVIISDRDLRGVVRKLAGRIPEDIGFACLNIIEEADELSGIDLAPKSIGAAAVDLVLAHLHRNDFGLPEHPATLMLAGRYHQGITTRPV